MALPGQHESHRSESRMIFDGDGDLMIYHLSTKTQKTLSRNDFYTKKRENFKLSVPILIIVFLIWYRKRYTHLERVKKAREFQYFSLRVGATQDLWSPYFSKGPQWVSVFLPLLLLLLIQHHDHVLLMVSHSQRCHQCMIVRMEGGCKWWHRSKWSWGFATRISSSPRVTHSFSLQTKMKKCHFSDNW